MAEHGTSEHERSQGRPKPTGARRVAQGRRILSERYGGASDSELTGTAYPGLAAVLEHPEVPALIAELETLIGSRALTEETFRELADLHGVPLKDCTVRTGRALGGESFVHVGERGLDASQRQPVLAWSPVRGAHMPYLVPAAVNTNASISHQVWLSNEWATANGYVAAWANCEYAAGVWGTFLVRDAPQFAVVDLPPDPQYEGAQFNELVEREWRDTHRMAQSQGFATGLPLWGSYAAPGHDTPRRALFIRSGGTLTFRDVPVAELQGTPSFTDPAGVIRAANRWVAAHFGNGFAGFPDFEQSGPQNARVYGVYALQLGGAVRSDDLSVSAFLIPAPNVVGKYPCNSAQGAVYFETNYMVSVPAASGNMQTQDPPAGTPMLRYNGVEVVCASGPACGC